jgi:hypothetical protein
MNHQRRKVIRKAIRIQHHISRQRNIPRHLRPKIPKLIPLIPDVVPRRVDRVLLRRRIKARRSRHQRPPNIRLPGKHPNRRIERNGRPMKPRRRRNLLMRRRPRLRPVRPQVRSPRLSNCSSRRRLRQHHLRPTTNRQHQHRSPHRATASIPRSKPGLTQSQTKIHVSLLRGQAPFKTTHIQPSQSTRSPIPRAPPTGCPMISAALRRLSWGYSLSTDPLLITINHHKISPF